MLVLALGFSLLLNAPGVHKKAFNQPEGWQRTVALAFTGPLASVSHALRLDRPRAGVQALAGRRGEDRIDTDLGIGQTTAGQATGPLPPRRSACSARRTRSS